MKDMKKENQNLKNVQFKQSPRGGDKEMKLNIPNIKSPSNKKSIQLKSEATPKIRQNVASIE